MSAVRNLEALINIENDLKSQYEDKINKLTQRVESVEQEKAQLEGKLGEQLQTITELTASCSETKRLEQQVRELSNRAEKLQGEIDAQKGKLKTAQKDVAELRAENKVLKQYDAEKIRKNLAVTKKKLTDERAATDLINKSLNKYKADNTELKRENEEMKAELETLKPAEESENAEAAENTEK